MIGKFLMIDTWQAISPPKQIILLSQPIKVLNIRESILLIEKGIKRSTIFIEKKHRVYQRDIFFNQKAKTNITGWPANSFSKFQYIPVYFEI